MKGKERQRLECYFFLFARLFSSFTACEIYSKEKKMDILMRQIESLLFRNVCLAYFLNQKSAPMIRIYPPRRSVLVDVRNQPNHWKFLYQWRRMFNPWKQQKNLFQRRRLFLLNLNQQVLRRQHRR